ncbi:MAG: hypothetical protein WC464_04545 [Bdellovibrionales bacterium]
MKYFNGPKSIQALWRRADQGNLTAKFIVARTIETGRIILKNKSGKFVMDGQTSKGISDALFKSAFSNGKKTEDYEQEYRKYLHTGVLRMRLPRRRVLRHVSQSRLQRIKP